MRFDRGDWDRLYADALSSARTRPDPTHRPPAGSFDKFRVKVRLLNIQTYTCGGWTVPMYRRAHVRFRANNQPDNAD